MQYSAYIFILSCNAFIPSFLSSSVCQSIFGLINFAHLLPLNWREPRKQRACLGYFLACHLRQQRCLRHFLTLAFLERSWLSWSSCAWCSGVSAPPERALGPRESGHSCWKRDNSTQTHREHHETECFWPNHSSEAHLIIEWNSNLWMFDQMHLQNTRSNTT